MPISTSDMQAIVAELSARDATLAKVIERHPLCRLGQSVTEQTHFESLVESVISQQLSVRAADTIYKRVEQLCDASVTPERMVEISEAQMRSAGVSGAKFKTILGLSEAAATGRIPVNSLHEIEDDTVIVQQLTSLWGIGTWTVDMFMMHQLGRLDVWPTGDLGVRRGWERMYSLEGQVAPRELDIQGQKFSPYRSVVAWYCWRAGDEPKA